MITITPAFESGDKALFPNESSGKTYFTLVKIEDILRIEKLEDDTYKIFYTAVAYVKGQEFPTIPNMKALTVEESKLITIEEFEAIATAY